MKAYAIIGAGFGDEGKGLMTDYLAAKYAGNSLVVRFNGGAQAGHTVQTASGQRHVFKHIGCGSFAGSPTYLSEFFICNPILFHEELRQLENINLRPQIYVDENAIVTTPYDMMINQILEEFRDQKRHGSCGVGINETVERNLHSRFAIKVHDLLDRKELMKKLQDIQQNWVHTRLQSLGVNQVSAAWQERLVSFGVMNYFFEEIDYFLEHTCMTDNHILKKFTTIIFEGAQGLLLDEQKGFFPHVTRSATGLKNILTIAKAVGISRIEIFYMTRAYQTRHGSGPLPFELKQLPYKNIVDQTNVTNQYQGSLRFAWLNLDLLQQAIFSDLADAQNQIAIRANLVVTCMDQLDPEVQFIKQNQTIKIPRSELLNEIQTVFPDLNLWASHGPTREAIREFWRGVSRTARDIEPLFNQGDNIQSTNF
jgi:adenylosuccinate synthase